MARPDRSATGMLFIDDDGTEMGGLVFRGHKDKNGQVSSNGHLSFDRYDQDQIFSIDAGEEQGRHTSNLAIWDRGDYPIEEGVKIEALPLDQQAEAWKKYHERFPGDHPRIILGRAADSASVLRLKDPSGRDRIVLRVKADGAPSVQLLDENGNVTSQLPNALPQ
jgi:hypothetical protein